ncbi:molybdate ABC transporter substrate-binding protein [Thalassotalea litorea]|uniref:Molybdate ABC transporter substrate-binding protein n=1 Tax=Thalassotalea litorea TaxID=2020715 RepID=A0A5R9ILJ4_9GAMM|nr:molybdate ABC transporter substrate-binding protein [Thalassotalea litorea]TLU66405.1 molybdate ABC transporter substrate-binding protein [Thalassotalea litorea]
MRQLFIAKYCSFIWLQKSMRLLFLSLALTTSFFSVASDSNIDPDLENPDESKPLKVAVAANFGHALKQIAEQFTQQTNIPVSITIGATGGLYQQIRHGAPFDVFLAANALHPQLLQKNGFIIEHSLQPYAIGQLAFFATDNAYTWDNLPNTYQQYGKFAIANPTHAPYGKAAKQLLTNIGLWSVLTPKLVQGNNVAQSYQFIRAQAASAGLVANSFLIEHQQDSTANLVPQHLYDPIEQYMLVLKSSKQAKAAKTFQQFLLSDAIQEKISKMGYYPVNRPLNSKH